MLLADIPCLFLFSCHASLQRSYGAYERTLSQQFPEPGPPIPTQWRAPTRIRRLLLGLDASSDDSDDGDPDDHNRGEGDAFGSHQALPFLPLPHKDRLRPTAERLQGETEGWGGRESEKAKMKKRHHRRILRGGQVGVWVGGWRTACFIGVLCVCACVRVSFCTVRNAGCVLPPAAEAH